MLPEGHEERADMIAALLKIGNASDNLIQSAIETALDSVEGLEDWRLAPEGQKPPETPAPEEEALTTYLENINFPAYLYRVGLTLCAFKRTVARPVLKPAARDPETGQIRPARDLAEALSRIVWMVPGYPEQLNMVDIDRAGVVLDTDTLEHVSILSYTVPQADKRKRAAQGVELSWIDPMTGQTMLRVIEDGKDTVPYPLELGGRLMLLEATLPRALVTKSMLGCFESYFVASIMLNRNTHYAGFVDKWSIGVEAPHAWENADGSLTPEPLGEDSKYIPLPARSGPNWHNFYQPTTTEEKIVDNGKVTTSQKPVPAQIGRWEPVDPKAITAALNHWRKAVRSEARQAFLELNDSTDTSGRAREVAAGDFLRSSEKLRRVESQFVSDFIELTLHLAALQLPEGEAARLRSYRATVNSRVQAFEPSADDKRVLLEEVNGNLIDWETYLQETGREDAAPIMQRAQKEAEARQAAALELAKANGGSDANGNSKDGTQPATG